MASQKLHDVADQLQSMESGRLRTLATAYAMSFLQNLERLVKGTLDGIPTQNGQTLEEEMDTPEVGDWLDLSFRPIMLYPDEWNIPYTQNKLYGKQQFERLLSQFRAITDHTGTFPILVQHIGWGNQSYRATHVLAVLCNRRNGTGDDG